MLIKNVGLTIGVVLAHIGRLLEGHHTGYRVGIGKIPIMLSSPGTLNKGDTGGYFTFLGQLFKFSVGQHLLQLAMTEMFKFRSASGYPAGGQNNGPNFFGIGVNLGISL